ncbi:glutamine--scyllo-inositol transaminase [Candidatus Omnitrophus magneticus]|uniref:Glutamine--scyllo-inositol transaminase n=1 Tax=Candidatus Omnitrophus magneticus TaxID=1609969 RepID=A0A0F0CS72_9BACT|nr:glutamine--scyllo-inositol transaminase [Candidatus Omnitrophus magneticus]
MNMNIPLVDLRWQTDLIKKDFLKEIGGILDSSAFILGPKVKEFEKHFAEYCGTKYCAGISSGTDALILALRAAGIEYGDEIITVSNTFIATSASISACGGKPVFVDIEEDSYNINPSLISRAITAKTKAIMPVHLYGQCADMTPIMKLAKNYGLFVIEDACQAHGAEYTGKRSGSFGMGAAFSFYPGKNLGAWGEGGAVVTNDQKIFDEVTVLRDHGSREKYIHLKEGFNMRLHGIQGAVLDLKLKMLDEWNALRRTAAGIYKRELSNVNELILPIEKPYAKHVYHLFVIRVKDRESLQKFLLDKGIGAGFHYKYPLHLQEAYAYLGYKEGDLPITEKIMKEIISLPIYPGITEEQIIYICKAVKEFFAGKK